MPEFAAPRVSVIVPAYNLETLLPRCLDSLLAQTFARWECVVVDDGSADGTGAVADAYAAKNPRFVVIHQQNGGVSAARNAGIEAARAPDLLFLDGDDALEPWAIDWCVATQDRFPDDLIGFHMRGAGDPADTPPDGSEQPRVFTAAQKQAYMAGNFGGNVTIKVFSADVIRQDKVAFDPALARGEDQDFCFRYLDAFFARRPGAAVRQYGLHLYVVYTDNGAGRASSQKVTAHGFQFMTVPDMVSSKILEGCGFNPRSSEQSDEYYIEGEDLAMIATAEMPLTGYHMDEIIDEKDLPLCYAGYSACFRKEAGAYGKHTRGLFRVHQFNKLEMYVFCLPENSPAMHEQIRAIEEEIWQELGIPYRVINIAAGDLGAPAAKKYDIEYWSPVDQKYRELTSCSNCTDFQARSLNIRVRRQDGSVEVLHTLNGTAISLARTMVAVIENYAVAGGKLQVPAALQPYLGGATEL